MRKLPRKKPSRRKKLQTRRSSKPKHKELSPHRQKLKQHNRLLPQKWPPQRPLKRKPKLHKPRLQPRTHSQPLLQHRLKSRRHFLAY